jgi:hypothetical protein
MQDTLQRTAPDDGLDQVGTAGKALIGAAAGAVGTWALDRADWRMWNAESAETRERTRSVRPNREPPAEVLAGTIEKTLGLDASPEQHELAGKVIHYGIGIAPAVAYALFRDRLPGSGPARGALYGVGLFLAQDEGLNTLTGLGANPQRYPWQAHARGLIAHTIYGVVTELALNVAGKALAKKEGNARPGRSRG